MGEGKGISSLVPKTSSGGGRRYSQASITYMNLKKNNFNDDHHHLMQILTPLSLDRIDRMCFAENSPFSFSYWMELLCRKDVETTPWGIEKDGNGGNVLARKAQYVITKSVLPVPGFDEVRMSVQQFYQKDL